MSFSNYIGKLNYLLKEDKDEVFPQLNPVTMENVSLHIPPEIEKLIKAFSNQDLKDLQHELKSPGKPNDKKVGKKLAELPPDTRAELIKKGLLKLDGQELFITGGQVRNFILHHYHQISHESNGWDLATEASPESVKLIILQAKRSGILPEDVQVKETHDKFHNLEIIYGKNTYPLSTFPFVNFQNAPRMYLQSMKQNMTANALYYSPKEKKIYDFHGGLADLRRQIARPIGNYKKKLRENALYPLMVVRIHAMMNRNGVESIEDELKNEISNFDLPKNIDPKLIRDEFILGLKSSLDKQKYIHILADLGLLKQIFRELKINDHPKIGDAKIPAVIIAQILEPNAPNFTVIHDHLMQLGYPTTETNSIVFLLKLPYYNDSNANEFYQDRLHSGISVKTLEKFIKTNELKNEKWLKSKILNNNYPKLIDKNDQPNSFMKMFSPIQDTPF